MLIKIQPIMDEAIERQHKRRIILSAGSMVLLGVVLAGCLLYAQAMLAYYHEHDSRPVGTYFQPWAGADAEKHLWAIGIPGDTEIIFTLIPIAWICLMVFYRKWPRVYLVTVIPYLLIGFIFMCILGGMDLANFL
jgi:hypothetical protein